MQTVPLETINNHLDDYLTQLTANADPILITNHDDSDSAVLMSKNDYDRMVETMRILSNPALMAKIRRGRQQIADIESKKRSRL
ncbi:hypothetical protein AYR62_14085 [Secundilactobacillus paracollinoides]|uniref:Antitoxin n=1 Tax=Secundilactobacillus paracollinoides TaxID=240427 RepID=A0A1B2IWZ8_9LACO|nr:type II toxin-antitoxin system Phd/YefM family antitoxin [Secundilactobacillus paracollinoides]ANZ60720.1 hypothetical protein AYR61_04775 [Secundilactobacillus paracollinoides]ANZ65095.1 hypothetical protein AYR62_14085 [Secundilactobacillus paracollinoides]ANZ66563.1 hypothetical protein AYR63_05060 [Secundilactobacillus paracollinoides]